MLACRDTAVSSGTCCEVQTSIVSCSVVRHAQHILMDHVASNVSLTWHARQQV
jgi:hypothetical protein